MEIDIISTCIISQIALYVLNWYYNLNLPWFVLWAPTLLCIMFTAIILIAVTILGISIMQNIDDVVNRPITMQFEEEQEK